MKRELSRKANLEIYWSISVPTPNLYGFELWPVTKRMWFKMSFLLRASGLSYSTDRVRSSDQSLYASMHRSRLRLGDKNGDLYCCLKTFSLIQTKTPSLAAIFCICETSERYGHQHAGLCPLIYRYISDFYLPQS